MWFGTFCIVRKKCIRWTSWLINSPKQLTYIKESILSYIEMTVKVFIIIIIMLFLEVLAKRFQ